MKKNLLKTSIILSIISLLLTGCQQGPAEKSGKKIDEKIQSLKDKVENKGPAQKAGEKLDKLGD
ncbi:MAG: hypothetical protein H0T84_13540 [Tatlockia sp.]|nr:hypothetical protein [Tatlockia sp.]